MGKTCRYHFVSLLPCLSSARHPDCVSIKKKLCVFCSFPFPSVSLSLSFFLALSYACACVCSLKSAVVGCLFLPPLHLPYYAAHGRWSCSALLAAKAAIYQTICDTITSTYFLFSRHCLWLKVVVQGSCNTLDDTLPAGCTTDLVVSITWSCFRPPPLHAS